MRALDMNQGFLQKGRLTRILGVHFSKIQQ